MAVGRALIVVGGFEGEICLCACALQQPARALCGWRRGASLTRGWQGTLKGEGDGKVTGSNVLTGVSSSNLLTGVCYWPTLADSLTRMVAAVYPVGCGLGNGWLGCLASRRSARWVRLSLSHLLLDECGVRACVCVRACMRACVYACNAVCAKHTDVSIHASSKKSKR